MKILRILALALAALAASAGAFAAPHVSAGAQIDFGAMDNVIDLTPALLTYHAPSGKAGGNRGRWLGVGTC